MRIESDAERNRLEVDLLFTFYHLPKTPNQKSTFSGELKNDGEPAWTLSDLATEFWQVSPYETDERFLYCIY